MDEVARFPSAGEVTALLRAIQQGECEAASKLVQLVYPELRRLAGYYMHNERGDHILQPTALINEAYMRLLGGGDVPWQNRAQFFAAAANSMRRILVDHARQRRAAKRGGAEQPTPVPLRFSAPVKAYEELLAVDHALEKLERVDKRQSEIVSLRYFGGLTIEETAEVLHVSIGTVKRDWKTARLWLHREIENV